MILTPTPIRANLTTPRPDGLNKNTHSASGYCNQRLLATATRVRGKTSTPLQNGFSSVEAFVEANTLKTNTKSATSTPLQKKRGYTCTRACVYARMQARACKKTYKFCRGVETCNFDRENNNLTSTKASTPQKPKCRGVEVLHRPIASKPVNPLKTHKKWGLN
ncbi:hypothetical protein GGE09_003571 [Roseobacter sp. N2S]|nr:hypothetical protein [Roseobacter sp. N2S]